MTRAAASPPARASIWADVGRQAKEQLRAAVRLLRRGDLVGRVVAWAVLLIAVLKERLRGAVRLRIGADTLRRLAANKFRLGVGLGVLVIALMGTVAGFSGLPGAYSPSSWALPVTMPGGGRTFTLTTTVTQLLAGVTTTYTVTETSATTVCLGAPPTNRTSLTPLIEVEVDPIERGGSQVVYVAVCSEWLGVAGAQVLGAVTDATGVEHPFSGTSNAIGVYTLAWQIDRLAAPGTFTVEVQVAKSGYTEAWGSRTFTVTNPA